MSFIKRSLLENTIIQYSLIMVIMVSLVGMLLAMTLTRKMTDYMIKSHISQFPVVISQIISNNNEIKSFFSVSGKGYSPEAVKGLFDGFLEFGKVFRIKVWSTQGIVIWSDQPELIGLDFSTNSHFKKALTGVIDYDYGDAHHDEDHDTFKKNNHHDEIVEKEKILEIYTPVFLNGTVIGIIQLYETDESLYTAIKENIQFVWIFIGLSGIALYLLQFFIFYRSYRQQLLTNENLHETQKVTLSALAYLAETRDNETGKHLDRTSLYVSLLANTLHSKKQFCTYLTTEYIQDLTISAPLHDIGKVGIPDQILLKPGKLTADEFDEMKKHCTYGAETLIAAEEKLSFRSFLKIAIQLTSSHHEKWNGQGYPEGLKGGDIPLSARIMALADVYDALRSERVYKKAFSHEKSMDIIVSDSGTHFDPQIVAAFVEQESEFKRISIDLAD